MSLRFAVCVTRFVSGPQLGGLAVLLPFSVLLVPYRRAAPMGALQP